MKLYHFTCGHAAALIGRTMVLEPHPQIQLDGRKLVWLTDLEAPNRRDIGLTSDTLHCDRMAYRGTVDCDAERWVEYLRALPKDVRRAGRALTLVMGLPMHWYVSESPVTVLALEVTP